MAALRCPKKRCRPVCVTGIDNCLPFKHEKFNKFQMSLLRGPLKGSPAIPVCSLHVCPGLFYQNTDNIQVALNRSPYQRSHFVSVQGVDVCACFAGQEVNHLHVPLLSSQVQWSPTFVFFHHLDIGTASTRAGKSTHDLKVAFLCCQVQRCRVIQIDRRFNRGIQVSCWDWGIIALML